MTITTPPRPPRLSDPVDREELEALITALIEEARQRARRRRQKYAAFAVVASLVAVGITTILERSTGAESQPPALAARTDAVAGAASSKIVFTSSRSMPLAGPGYVVAPEIYVMNADGRGERRLARGWGPTWSPDGTKLAFVGGREPDFEVYVMNADGSEQRVLVRSAGSFAWSPDGRRIAFDRAGTIYVVNADGSGQRRLTWNKASESGGPVWSPDGRTIAFARKRKSDVYVMNADGSAKRRLTRGFAPRWSPDGGTILFERGGSIYAASVDGSAQRRLGSGTAPAWSPDGQTILFRRSSWPFQPGELLVVNADGSARRSLGVATFGTHSWSSDGQKVAFAAGAVSGGYGPARDRTGPDIYVMNADGSGLRKLTNRPGWEAAPLWSPAQS